MSSDLLVRGTDPRIRIHTKMSRVRNIVYDYQIQMPKNVWILRIRNISKKRRIRIWIWINIIALLVYDNIPCYW